MTENLVSLDFNGVKFLFDSNVKLVRLIPDGSLVNKSWHDTETGAVYQVPTGKKARLIFVELFESIGTTVLSTTTAVDAATGAVTLIDPGAGDITNTIILTASIAADLFITTTVAALNGTIGVIFLLEESAT